MPVLVLSRNATTIPYALHHGETRIGRYSECEIILDDNRVSGVHARILFEGTDFYVEDLNSRNGTQVNGRRITDRQRLQHDDSVVIASRYQFRYEALKEASPVSAPREAAARELNAPLLAAREQTAREESAPEGTAGVQFTNDESEASGPRILGTAHARPEFETRPEAKLKALFEITRALAGTIDLEKLLPKILDTMFRIFLRADRGVILLKDSKSGQMIPRAMRHRRANVDDTVQISRTIMRKVLEERSGILSLDATRDMRFATRSSITDLAIRSLVCVPMLGLDGEPVGIIHVDSQSTAEGFTAEDLELLMIVANQAALACETTRLLEAVLEKQRNIHLLEKRQVEMSQFFSPKVVETISISDLESVLAPQVLPVTVLFCDMRGFSRRSENQQDDLPELLERCSAALGVMSRHILDQGGVISDFQGDAALGFWGWPVASPDGPLAACRAALGIYQEFAEARRDPAHRLRDFHVGIGVAHGDAIAGKMGTQDQAKVGVFGPVVNLGSRLEGLTKQLRAPILLDEATGQFVREALSREEARTRRLGRLRPYGMQNALTVYELLPPVPQDSRISDESIELFEAAVAQFEQGNWSRALEMLDALPVMDRAKDFLMSYIALRNYEPPTHWDRVVEMLGK